MTNNKYYSIPVAFDLCMPAIKAALMDKYGDGVTIHYDTTRYLVFSCAAISDKVIRLERYNDGRQMDMKYGDAWDSGSTITNQVNIFYGIADESAPIAYDLVLGDAFMLFSAKASTSGGSVNYNGFFIVAKLTNDVYIASGNMQGSGNGTTKITTGETARLLVFQCSFTDDYGFLYGQPVMFMNNSGQLLLNEDSSIAYIEDLSNISYSSGNSNPYKEVDKFVTGSGSLYTNSVLVVTTSIMAPL